MIATKDRKTCRPKRPRAFDYESELPNLLERPQDNTGAPTVPQSVGNNTMERYRNLDSLATSGPPWQYFTVANLSPSAAEKNGKDRTPYGPHDLQEPHLTDVDSSSSHQADPAFTRMHLNAHALPIHEQPAHHQILDTQHHSPNPLRGDDGECGNNDDQMSSAMSESEGGSPVSSLHSVDEDFSTAQQGVALAVDDAANLQHASIRHPASDLQYLSADMEIASSATTFQGSASFAANQDRANLDIKSFDNSVLHPMPRAQQQEHHPQLFDEARHADQDDHLKINPVRSRTSQLRGILPRPVIFLKLKTPISVEPQQTRGQKEAKTSEKPSELVGQGSKSRSPPSASQSGLPFDAAISASKSSGETGSDMSVDAGDANPADPTATARRRLRPNPKPSHKRRYLHDETRSATTLERGDAAEVQSLKRRRAS